MKFYLRYKRAIACKNEGCLLFILFKTPPLEVPRRGRNEVRGEASTNQPNN